MSPGFIMDGSVGDEETSGSISYCSDSLHGRRACFHWGAIAKITCSVVVQLPLRRWRRRTRSEQRDVRGIVVGDGGGE